MLFRLTKTKIIFMSIFAISSGLQNSYAQTSCIDYNTVGMAGCDSNSEISTTTIPITKTSKAGTHNEKSMESKIDDYIEAYGKPPREFIEFSLNPTLENALKWAKKNKELKAHNKAISNAWGQAETILQLSEEKGEKIPDFEYKATMPEVPDFGVKTSSELNMDRRRGVGNSNKAVRKDIRIGGGVDIDSEANKEERKNLISNKGKTDKELLEALQSELLEESARGSNLPSLPNISSQVKKEQKSIGGINQAGNGKMKISYYFSAECPYCKKFEPVFSQVLNEIGSANVEVTCVDMTPSGAKSVNVSAKIDCQWRPLERGEVKNFGIKSTPSLIVDYGDKNSQPGKVEGFVDLNKLRNFLLK